MRLVKFTDEALVSLKDSYQRFPVWIDADAVLSVCPNFEGETWGGRTYWRPAGTKITMSNGSHVVVSGDPAEAVAIIEGVPY